MPDPDDAPMDRRKFFRRGLSELIRPLASAISPLERVARKIGEMESAPASRTIGKIAPNLWLRPPGAIAEKQFVQTCDRSNKCVEACPAKCIKLEPGGKNGAGVPYIEIDSAACVVCDGLYCMHVCPSGALVPTSINDIDMGTAVWHEESCTRNGGSDCQICVDECPLGEMAITVKGAEIEVKPLGCIGCGMCQHFCPTAPKSISVIPKAAKEA
jgi:ferredoxin-type protein NapG